MHAPNNKLWQQTAYMMMVAGILLLTAAWWIGRGESRDSSVPAPTFGAAPPHELVSKKPSSVDINNHNVASEEPKHINIPAISVPKTRLIGLGVMANHQIAAPSNIYDVGWYKASARPGQNGALFVYGHHTVNRTPGIFFNLKNLKRGERVTVTNGAGKVFHYKVVTTKIYKHDQVDMKEVLSPVSSSRGLNIMTCHGQLIPGKRDFSERLVVFTEAV